MKIVQGGGHWYVQGFIKGCMVLLVITSTIPEDLQDRGDRMSKIVGSDKCRPEPFTLYYLVHSGVGYGDRSMHLHFLKALPNRES